VPPHPPSSIEPSCGACAKRGALCVTCSSCTLDLLPVRCLACAIVLHVSALLPASRPACAVVLHVFNCPLQLLLWSWAGTAWCLKMLG
jgi:hypothetical protein